MHPIIAIPLATVVLAAVTPLAYQLIVIVRRHKAELAELGDYPKPPTDEERAEWLRAIRTENACSRARD